MTRRLPAVHARNSLGDVARYTRKMGDAPGAPPIKRLEEPAPSSMAARRFQLARAM